MLDPHFHGQRFIFNYLWNSNMVAFARFYILAFIALRYFISCASPHFHGQYLIFNCLRNSNIATIARFYILLYISAIIALVYFISCANPIFMVDASFSTVSGILTWWSYLTRIFLPYHVNTQLWYKVQITKIEI